jgi:hypothetical protein
MRLSVGSLPPAVYWRRRALVLAGVLVLLFLVAQACRSAAASPEDGSAAGDPSPTPTAAAPGTADPGRTPAPTGTGSPRPEPDSPAATGDPSGPPAGEGDQLDPADPAACKDVEMLIIAQTSRAKFPAGTSVQFTIRIENDADRSCRRDIGGNHRELYLRKGTGATKLWSSRDCGGPSGSQVRKLEPGFVTSHYIVWHGRSSASCAGGEPTGDQVEPGNYQLVARLGTAFSEPTEITVTG